jgi:LacI family transcriptional regulator
MGTLKDIATEVGISPASVSIYLNNKTTNRVSDNTKKKIDIAVKKNNYSVNIFARSLATSKSKLVGILLPTAEPFFLNEYTNELLSGIQSKLSEYGYGIVFLPASSSSSVEVIEEQLKRSVGCDGYVIFSTGFCSKKQMEENVRNVGNLELPYVTLNIPRLDSDINQILIPAIHYPKGIEYLISKGHTKIITLLGRTNGYNSQILYDNTIKLYSELGLKDNINRIFFGNYEAFATQTIILESLGKNSDITAICCMSDIMAIAAINACKTLGYKIPEDISIIGRNNSQVAKLANPTLTTVDLMMRQSGRTAASLLHESIKGEETIQQICINEIEVISKEEQE